MRFETYGDKTMKKIMLIHPMFTDGGFLSKAVGMLQSKYFVIVPTLSGHYEGSVYTTIKDEERQITEFLQQNGINRIDYLVGFSIGGNIAYDYFCNNTGNVDKVIVDSAPLFNFASFVCDMVAERYRKCLVKIKCEGVDAAKELNKHFKGMGESQKDVAKIVNSDSLEGLVSTCYRTKIYDLEKEKQKRVTFVYGSKDLAGFSRMRLKKYRNSTFYELMQYGHCEYFMTETADYVEKLLK